ncbi:MAG: thermonuclease family protein [Silicimonas sp.]|nr:thermonuclease family protein [Silicimonas sp.]
MRKAIIIAIALLFAPQILFPEPRILDGDTLELGGVIYRLNGIDAPEQGQRCGDWNCGSAATDALVDIVKGRDIACTPRAKDAYGRVIATCFADGRDIGADMVDKGLAWAFRRYSDAYVRQERSARARGRGIWATPAIAPWDYRKNRWQAAAQSAPDGCPIKGNISRNGRIYHAPWSPWYARTRISPEKGERWFCSEAEALAAGWRAPYWD